MRRRSVALLILADGPIKTQSCSPKLLAGTYDTRYWSLSHHAFVYPVISVDQSGPASCYIRLSYFLLFHYICVAEDIQYGNDDSICCLRGVLSVFVSTT